MEDYYWTNPTTVKVLEEVLPDIKETTEILLELQKKYGLRRNNKEISTLMERTTFISDSGYFSDHNLEISDKMYNKYLNNAQSYCKTKKQ